MKTYTERGFRLRREFTLADGCITFSGKEGGSFHQRTIALDGLLAEPARSLARDTRFESGIAWVCFVAVLLLAVVPSLFHPDRFPVEQWLRLLYGTITAVLLLIIKYVLFPFRIEYATFYSPAGVPVLSIGNRGNDKVLFEEFVAAVAEGVSNAGASPRSTAR